jgi:hypothetical protein
MAADEKPKASKKPEDNGTPSGSALAQVGRPKEGASDEELNAHAEAYGAAKAKVRWGH